MSSEKLVDVLIEIRDQQKRQVENFERAIASQGQFQELQRKGQKHFVFLVYAPWAALAVMLVYMLMMTQTLLR